MTPPRSAEEWANEAMGWLVASHSWAIGAYEEVVKAMRAYATEQVAQVKDPLIVQAREREACGDILKRHIRDHLANEQCNRKIGNVTLEQHNKWCAIVLETALAAIRGEGGAQLYDQAC